MIKIRVILFVLLCSVLFAFCETFTDPFDYSTKTTQVNSTNYTAVIFNTSTSTVIHVPFGGLSILNTNAATTARCDVIWADGQGHEVKLFRGFVSGGTNPIAIPMEFHVEGTNQFIKIRLDTPMTNGVQVKYYYITSVRF